MDRPHDQKIYISYDSTNKERQAGDREMVEAGKPKDSAPGPVFNYFVAYDTDNQDPLFYEEYPGSIVDVSQLQYLLGKAKAYGYRNSGFLLDRGYLGKGNIRYMDENGFDFLIFVKRLKKLVSALVIANQGTFEKNSTCYVRSNDVYAKTVALIIRCRFHRALRDAKASMQNRQNYMTVPAAMKELEKIELIRQFDGVYRLDHAVTARQKALLQAFDADEDFIRGKAEKLSEDLRRADKPRGNGKGREDDETEDNGRC